MKKFLLFALLMAGTSFTTSMTMAKSSSEMLPCWYTMRVCDPYELALPCNPSEPILITVGGVTYAAKLCSGGQNDPESSACDIRLDSDPEKDPSWPSPDNIAEGTTGTFVVVRNGCTVTYSFRYDANGQYCVYGFVSACPDDQ